MNRRNHGIEAVQDILNEMSFTIQQIAEIQEELHKIAKNNRLDYQDVDEIFHTFCNKDFNIQRLNYELSEIKGKIKSIPEMQIIRDAGDTPVYVHGMGVLTSNEYSYFKLDPKEEGAEIDDSTPF